MATIAALSEALNLTPAGMFIVTVGGCSPNAGRTLDKMDWTVEKAQAVGEFSLGYAQCRAGQSGTSYAARRSAASGFRVCLGSSIVNVVPTPTVL